MQRLSALRVQEARWDIPADPPEGYESVKIETDMANTLGPPTHWTIFVTKPFQLWFTHKAIKKKKQYQRWPVDPLPMGIPIVIEYTGWEDIIIRPKLLPAQVRVYFQRAEEVVL